MNIIFKDPALQKQFEQKGYVILKSLLSAKEVDTLTELFSQHKNEYGGPFHTTHFSADVNYKTKVHNTIVQQVFPKAEEFLKNMTPVFGNFMIKNPDPTFAMDLHADWAYVPEPENCSAAIWVPLVDVNEVNGCLGVIEGSHKVTNTIRGPLIRQSSRQHENEWVKKYGNLLPTNAGDAIIYNHALLHYSPPNKSNAPRPALNLSLIPKGVKHIHYCMPEGATEIEEYEVPDTDFYIHYNHFQRPQTGAPINKLPTNTVPYMDGRMKHYNAPPFLKTILNWF